MNNKFKLAFVRRAVVAAVALMAGAAAQAQGAYVGGAIGSTDGFGTAVRVYGGSHITNIIGWEAQATSFGKGRYGSGWTRSANEFGASVTATLPLPHQWSAFGKLGLHFVDYNDNFPNRSDSGLELGIGLGVKWQFVPNMAARLEVQHIGGEAGDLVLAGLQVHF